MCPGKRLIAAAVAWLALGMVAAVWPLLTLAWQAAGLALGVAVIADLLFARAACAPGKLDVTRTVSGSLPIGVVGEVTLKIVNRTARALALEIYDHHPAHARVEGLPLSLTLPHGRSAELRYRYTPLRRGDVRFTGCELRIAGPLGLWQARRFVDVVSAVRIYPNFSAVMRYSLLATDNRLSQIGVLQRRRRGEGLDFHQLREYREGDAQRQIDWKATARVRKLISREYRDERDQQILFLIDCGRRMGASDTDSTHLTHFDHVLNAALLLGYVSLRQGDAVGYMTFATDTPRYAAPRKSAATVNRLLNGLYDIQPGLRAPDYYGAAVALATRVKRRAFVIVLSNLRDDDDDVLAPALALLRQRHLVLFASLREPYLDEAVTRPVRDLDSALTYTAAQDYLQARTAALKRIAHGGIMTLDVLPSQLPIALVNRYLEIKREGRL